MLKPSSFLMMSLCSWGQMWDTNARTLRLDKVGWPEHTWAPFSPLERHVLLVETAKSLSLKPGPARCGWTILPLAARHPCPRGGICADQPALAEDRISYITLRCHFLPHGLGGGCFFVWAFQRTTRCLLPNSLSRYNGVLGHRQCHPPFLPSLLLLRRREDVCSLTVMGFLTVDSWAGIRNPEMGADPWSWENRKIGIIKISVGQRLNCLVGEL